MSELQTALLAIGAGVIVAVYLFGWWQQRRLNRKFGEAFKGSHEDALYQEKTGKPVEHSLSPSVAMPADAADEGIVLEIAAAVTEPASKVVEERAAVEALEEMAAPESLVPPAVEHYVAEMPEVAPPVVEPPVAAPPITAVASKTTLDESCKLLDARSDFIIELHPADPSPAAMLDGLWQRKFDFGKPVQVCGLTLNNQWERAISEGQTLYAQFRIALQLVDRGGAISTAKLTEFRDLVLGVAKQIRAEGIAPDIEKTHLRAVELDGFCVEVDQLVGVNLVPTGDRLLSGEKLAQAAVLQGMTLESDGAFHLMDAHGYSLFSLINQDDKPFPAHTLETFRTAGVTLLLDVPRVENPAAQFDRMVRAAQEFAKELQANLVDDHRVVLSDNGLARIRAQIALVEAKMRGNGIAPGGAQARRLFS
ncbi:MAG TPA: cell division protein ZipA C-terminal FtsZ-binding domain-containing protein [Gallionella sp.]|nr:cell division protein ZipA C-terminal FtsZ-binding domain-containing protein [Gallionella sp.]